MHETACAIFKGVQKIMSWGVSSVIIMVDEDGYCLHVDKPSYTRVLRNDITRVQ